MRTLLLLLTALLFGHQSLGQLSRASLNSPRSIFTIKGDYYRNHRNYVFAVNNYSKATKQNPKDVAAMLGMADAYHHLGKDDLAMQWYRKGLAAGSEVGPEHVLKFISILNSTGNSAEVGRWIAYYMDKFSASGQHADSTVFFTENLAQVNSNGSESGPLLLDGKLIFSSDRGSGIFASFNSMQNTDGSFGAPGSFHNSMTSGKTPGAFAMAKNPSTIFFTSEEAASKTTPPPMEIYFGTIPSTPSDAVKFSKLRFKNFDHSMGHPAVNSTGTVLYFAAHSPRHTRGFDLYRTEFNGKKWSAPVALPASINSHGDELYPVLANDSILYFASSGHGGLGGLDIFRVNLHHKHHPRPEHLPAPVNSPSDDCGFVLNGKATEAFLSSDRPGGLGGKDLYRVYLLPAKSKRSSGPYKEELFIYTSKGDEIKLSGSSKENLKFDFQPGRKYNLVVEYDNYQKGTAQTMRNAATLTRLNVYTFDIQKSTETVYDQKNKSKPVQDIHINPGDLVTFQLIPNLTQDPLADAGKIQFQRSEAIIGDRESIMFSYVAEGGPAYVPENTPPVTDLKQLDTVSTVQPLAKESSLPANKTPAKTVSPENEKTKVEPSTLLASTTAVIAPPDQTTGTVAPKPAAEQSKPPATMAPGATPAKPSDKLPSKPDSSMTVNRVVKAVDDVKKKSDTVATAKDVTRLAQQTPKQDSIRRVPDSADPSKPAQLAGLTRREVEKTPSSDTIASKTAISKQTVTPADVTATKAATAEKQKPAPTDSTRLAIEKQVLAQTVQPESTTRNAELAASERSIGNTSTTEKNTSPGNKPENPATINQPIAEASNRSEKTVVAPSGQPEEIAAIAGNAISSSATSNQEKVAQAPLDAAPTLLVARNDEIQYRVQIAASKSKLNDELLQKIYPGPRQVRSFQEDGYHKYFIEQTPSFPSAKRVLKESGVSQAFISAYKGETKLTLQQALALQKNAGNESDGTSATVPTASANGNISAASEVAPENQLPEKAERSNEPGSVSQSEITTVPLAQTAKVSPTNSADRTRTESTQNTPSQDIASNKNEPPISTPVPAANEGELTTQVTTQTRPVAAIATAADRRDFSYRLQIAASKTKLNSTRLKKIYPGENEVRVFQEEGLYKYYILETNNYFVAHQTLKKIDSDEAFISAYKKNVKQVLQDAIAEQYGAPEVKAELAASDSIMGIATVNFELDEFELQSEQIERLKNTVINILRTNPTFHAIVNGYTDIRGSEAYNFGLSQERALFVEQRIVAEGIDAARVKTQYFGESQVVKYCPEHDDCDESIHQANRRVEILLLVDRQ